MESVFATNQLYRRTPRAARPVAERRALQKLGRGLVDCPKNVLQVLTDVAAEVAQADSAGISILEKDGAHFRWRAISGVYAEHLGGMTPRDFSPCGTTIDRNTPQLISRPGRYFSYFNDIHPPICEGLLVPFSLGDKPVGTIWIIAHDERRKFDLEDMRVLTALANFASAGYELVSALDSRREVAEGLEARWEQPAGRDRMIPISRTCDAEPRTESLSRREFEIMSMTVRGVSQKEIAFALEISAKTVATHRGRLLRKLNLNGSFDLLRYALENHLVDWNEVH